MKNLVVAPTIEAKLKTKHGVTVAEVRQCFLTRNGQLLVDNRALTRTNPPTLWFIAETNRARTLKIVYVQVGLQVNLKTAYEPNAAEMAIYQRHGNAMENKLDTCRIKSKSLDNFCDTLVKA